jgi:hypothetical protein
MAQPAVEAGEPEELRKLTPTDVGELARSEELRKLTPTDVGELARSEELRKLYKQSTVEIYHSIHHDKPSTTNLYTA